ncbi:MAG: cytidine deaminase [Bacillota bacterium]|nr:cytidine deaminase [Bacillota bacterium]
MTDVELLLMAMKASEKAYAPYSKFKVGAALECTDGTVFTGCNVENSAYGDTICAERTAMVKAVSEGEKNFTRIAIYADSKDYCYPCGSCRQFMSEFNDGEMTVLCAKGDGGYVSHKLKELLPQVFNY